MRLAIALFVAMTSVAIAKPVVAEPVVAEPVAKPVVAEPVAKPAVAEPVAKPAVAKPVAKPAVAKPVAKPAVGPERWQTLPLPPPMPSPAASGFVDVDGAQIYYATFGKGAPVILLHGGMGNSDHWAHQVSALADKLQVVVIDSRGQGRSTRTRAAPSYATMVRDVLAVMDHLQLDKAAIVGWSDGGEVALELGVHHPERVTKLFVFGASYDAKGKRPRAVKSFATFDRYTAKCRADYQRLSKTPKQWSALVRWLLPLWRRPMGLGSDSLGSIRTPTIVADGDHDEIVERAHVEEMAQLIPNARLEIFADTSHFALWQDPASFNQVLVDFLVPAPAK
jgi:pimeloyl-ACP methyl ester carboxylesterase